MILVTGAAGKTGQAVIQAAFPAGEPIRAMIRHESQAEAIRALGVHEVTVGDMRDPDDMLRACDGIRAVYHICSNMNPDEVMVGRNAIEAARKAGVKHFVYHSVLHPQVKAMPHHWNKLEVEALLFESRLPFTIMQPAAYMQNVLGYWSKMAEEGVYAVPYSTQALFSLVDLTDLAEAAARVLREPGMHNFAVYELCGDQILSNSDVARLVGDAIGRKVTAVALDRTTWETKVRAEGMSEFSVRTLLQMFAYYDAYGFVGNGNVLKWLLERPSTCFEEFLLRFLKFKSSC